MYSLHIFEAVYKSHVLTLEKKGLECGCKLLRGTLEARCFLPVEIIAFYYIHTCWTLDILSALALPEPGIDQRLRLGYFLVSATMTTSGFRIYKIIFYKILWLW